MIRENCTAYQKTALLLALLEDELSRSVLQTFALRELGLLKEGLRALINNGRTDSSEAEVAYTEFFFKSGEFGGESRRGINFVFSFLKECLGEQRAGAILADIAVDSPYFQESMLYPRRKKRIIALIGRYLQKLRLRILEDSGQNEENLIWREDAVESLSSLAVSNPDYFVNVLRGWRDFPEHPDKPGPFDAPEGLRCAALLLRLLGIRISALLFSFLQEDEIKLISQELIYALDDDVYLNPLTSGFVEILLDRQLIPESEIERTGELLECLNRLLNDNSWLIEYTARQALSEEFLLDMGMNRARQRKKEDDISTRDDADEELDDLLTPREKGGEPEAIIELELSPDDSAANQLMEICRDAVKRHPRHIVDIIREMVAESMGA